jgi:hypothetical protein
MADPIAFIGIEKQYLVRVGYGLGVLNMPDVNATIRKHQLGRGCALFSAHVPATASAQRIPDRNDWRLEQGTDSEFRAALQIV